MVSVDVEIVLFGVMLVVLIEACNSRSDLLVAGLGAIERIEQMPGSAPTNTH